MFWLVSQPGVRDEWNREDVVWLNICPVWIGAVSLTKQPATLSASCGCSMWLQTPFSVVRDPHPPRRASSGSHCSTFPCLAQGPQGTCGSGQPLASKNQKLVTSECFFLPGQALFPFFPLGLLAGGSGQAAGVVAASAHALSNALGAL